MFSVNSSYPPSLFSLVYSSAAFLFFCYFPIRPLCSSPPLLLSPPPFLSGASASIILYFFYFSSSFSNSFCISYFSVLRCLFLGLLSMFSLFVPGNCCCLPEGFLRCEDVAAAGEYPFFYKGHPPCDATYITYPPGRYFRGEQVFYLPPPQTVLVRLSLELGLAASEHRSMGTRSPYYRIFVQKPESYDAITT